MAKPRTPRRAWIDQGLRALAAGGPDAVRIEALAAELGVTKGGFYGYFTDRRALLDEMLDTWEREVTDRVIDQVETAAEALDARAKLRRLFAIAATADAEPMMGVAVDLAIRDWARREPEVALRLSRVDGRQLDYLRSLFAEFCPDPVDVEARCLLVMSVRIGDHLMPTDHPNATRDQVMERALRQQLI